MVTLSSKVIAITLVLVYLGTVEPRYNEVPRDWQNVFFF